MEQDYYKILGVNRNASQADIQKAYRKMARKYHPDVAEDKKSAKQKFQEIQTAFDVLSDPDKREMYDRYGSSFEAMGGGKGPRGQAGGGFQFDEIDLGQLFGGRGGAGGFGGFEDLFQQFTRGGAGPRAGRRAPQRGADLAHEATVPLQTAVMGGEVNLSVQRPNGKVETVSAKIPAGIEDGKKIRLRGQGQPSPTGGQAGDLLVTVHVSSHPHFERRGKHLYLRVPVTLAEAALGGKIDIPTPKGTISLTVPPGTSSGKRLRLRGMGVQSKDSPGDLYAEILIALPESLDKEAKDFIRKLTDRQPNPRADLKW